MPSRNFSDLWGGVFATNPFMDMQRDFNRMFGDAFRRGTPRVDVRETDDEVCVVADVPGVSTADIDVRVDGTTLTFTAQRQGETERQDESYHMMERSRGLMRRSVQLPFAPDPERVRANYENGVLTVRMPKAGPKQRGQRIDVHGGGPTSSSTAAGDDSNAQHSSTGPRGSSSPEGVA